MAAHQRYGLSLPLFAESVKFIVQHLR